MSKETMKLALEALEQIAGAMPFPVGKQAITAIREALAEQPDQPSKPWVPVTQELLHKQHPWLYEPMWIAMKDGSVIQGHYEWRQGWNPDRFIAEGFNHWAFDAAYVMPVIKPTPPAIEATIGITGEQK